MSATNTEDESVMVMLPSLVRPKSVCAGAIAPSQFFFFNETSCPILVSVDNESGTVVIVSCVSATNAEDEGVMVMLPLVCVAVCVCVDGGCLEEQHRGNMEEQPLIGWIHIT